MGYRTPNVDRIGKEGALFTDAYAQQSCTAGRSSFILGEHPFRTGLLTIGMPGSPQGIPDWAPTIADLLKEQGSTTGARPTRRYWRRGRPRWPGCASGRQTPRGAV
jgi:arylsulfatase